INPDRSNRAPRVRTLRGPTTIHTLPTTPPRLARLHAGTVRYSRVGKSPPAPDLWHCRSLQSGSAHNPRAGPRRADHRPEHPAARAIPFRLYGCNASVSSRVAFLKVLAKDQASV